MINLDVSMIFFEKISSFWEKKKELVTWIIVFEKKKNQKILQLNVITIEHILT